MKFLISVIIPVYNVEAYISECLDSIIKQSIGLRNVEVLIINDGSTDGSVKIIENYLNKYQSLKVVNLKRNCGTGIARNIGLQHANGEYIAFIDADDYISLNTFEHVISCFHQTSCDIVLYEYDYVSPSGKKYPRNPSANLFEEDCLISDIKDFPEIIFATSVCNKVFKKSLLNDLKFTESRMEDVRISTLTTFKATSIYVTNQCKYYYRKREAKRKSKTDSYYIDKQNYLDHLQVNYELENLKFEYPQFKNLITLFNARSIPPFLYNMLMRRVFKFNEMKEFFYKAKYLLLDVDKHVLIQISEDFTRSCIKIAKNNNLFGFVSKFFALITISKIKRIMPKLVNHILKILDVCIVVCISLIYFFNPRYKNIWLVCDRGDDAQDNGYFLFKYLREVYPNMSVYYLINKNSIDYEAVSRLGNVIPYKSLKHKLFFVLSERLISSHKGTIEPWNYRIFKKIFGKLTRKKKYVFLQHGITKDDVSDLLGRSETQFDLFITGAKPEYDFVSNMFGYNSNEVAYTGFPRFDSLYNAEPQNCILLMPTWRKKIFSSGYRERTFTETQFFKTYQSLINNKEFHLFLEQNNLFLLFYPHYEIQKYIRFFSSFSNRVKILNKDTSNVQELLKISKLLITDYSSVFFDFAYMDKPVIYYQFDQEEFFRSHYKKGYFDYYKDGFGPVITIEEDVIKYIVNSYQDGQFIREKRYSDRTNQFFALRDSNNCKRVFEAISNL